MDSTLTAPAALRLCAAAVAACGILLCANAALYCYRTGCNGSPPFVSHIMVSEHSELAALESALIVSLTLLVAFSATLQLATGGFTATQFQAAWVAVPFAIVCASFDTKKFTTLHVTTYFSLLVLSLCLATASWLPLLIFTPYLVRHAMRKRRARSDASPRTKRLRPYGYGPDIQVFVLVLVVLGIMTANLSAAARLEGQLQKLN